MLLEQGFLDVALLLGAVFKKEYAVRAENGLAVACQHVDRIEPVTPGDKCSPWFALQCFERRVAIANVWWIRYNDVELESCYRSRPVALNKCNIRDTELARILPGDGKRGRIDVGRRYLAHDAFTRYRKRDCATTGAEIENLRCDIARNLTQCEIDQQFGLGARHERGGADHQFERPKLLDPRDIRHRLTCDAAIEQAVQALAGRVVQRILRMRDQVAARNVNGARQQNLGIEACRVAHCGELRPGVLDGGINSHGLLHRRVTRCWWPGHGFA